MGLLDQATRLTDQADLVILSIVETIRDQKQPATPSAVAALIGGAPMGKITDRLQKLRRLQVLDALTDSYQLSQLGAELLSVELTGWSPSEREQQRRDAEMLSAIAGSWRQG